MMRMVVSLMMLQLQSALMGMGHGKLKQRRQSEELSFLRKGLKYQNDDYDNMLVAEYTPLKITTHAPRFKIIDNQLKTRNPLVGTTKWRRKKIKATQDKKTQDWRLDLPMTVQTLKNDTWHVDTPDYDATRTLNTEGDQNTMRKWEPDPNTENSLEKNKNVSTSLSTESNDTDTNYSESSVEVTRSNKFMPDFDLPTFDSEKDATRVRKDGDYVYTWRTWDAESKNDDDSEKPSGRLDSASNDSEATEATEISEKDTELKKTQRMNIDELDSVSNDAESTEATEISERDIELKNTLRMNIDEFEIKEALKKQRDQYTIADNTEPYKDTTVFNKRIDRQNWQQFSNSSTMDTTVNVAELRQLNNYWHRSVGNIKLMKHRKTSTIRPNGKHRDLHLRIGSGESELSMNTK